MHLRAYRRDVLLLELARLVALDECRLADAAVAHEHELEFGHGSGRLSGRGGEGGEGTVRRREKGEGHDLARWIRQTSRAKRANRGLAGRFAVLTILTSKFGALARAGTILISLEISVVRGDPPAY